MERLAAETPWRPLPQTLTMQESGADMGRKMEEGRGSSSGGKTRLPIPMEWNQERRATRPIEWSKPSVQIARDWVGESSRRGAPKPPEWKGCLRGEKPLE